MQIMKFSVFVKKAAPVLSLHQNGLIYCFSPQFFLLLAEADLEGVCGACAPHPKIRKTYVIQR
jgi:hypothetical protein